MNKEKFVSWIKGEQSLWLIGLTLLVLATYIRYIPSGSAYFNDPDTFHHYEIFKRVINGNFNLFYDKIYPPTGDIFLTMPFLYILWGFIAKVMSIFGVSELMGFKVGQVVVFAITMLVIGYFVHRITKSVMAGIGSMVVYGFTISSWLRSYATNSRGDQPFLMFFSIILLLFYMLFTNKVNSEKKKWLISGTISVLFPMMMTTWLGSMFAIPFFIMLIGLITIHYSLNGRQNELMDINKMFIVPTIITSSVALVIYKLLFGDLFTQTHVVRVLMTTIVSFIFLSIFIIFSKFASTKLTKNKFIITIFGLLLVFSLIFVSKLSSVVAYATPGYNPISSTIQELTPTTFNSVMTDYSMFGSDIKKGGDGLFYIIGVVLGSILFIWNFLEKNKFRNILVLLGIIVAIVSLKYPSVTIGNVGISIMSIFVGLVTLYVILYEKQIKIEDLLIATIFVTFNIILWWASRYLYLATFMVATMFGYVIRETIKYGENIGKIKFMTSKQIITILLLLVFIGSSYVNGKILYKSGDYMKKTGGVPPEWVSALKFIRNDDPEGHVVVTWWDYGYWIESSLLGDHPALIDGAYAREYDYIVAKWFSESNYTFNWDLFNVRYFIIWTSDIGKMNAINYLGGMITKREKENSMPIMILPYYNTTDEGSIYTNGYVVAIVSNNTTFLKVSPESVVQTRMTIINNTINNKTVGSVPVVDYVSLVESNKYIILFRGSVYDSQWYTLTNFINMLSPNIVPTYVSMGYGEIIVYRFFPFLLYGMKTNNNTKIVHFQDTNWTIPKNATFIITAYGRSGTGDLIAKLRNGSMITLASNVTISKRTEVKLNNAKIENVSAVYFRTWGVYGKFNDLVKVNGRIARNKDISDFIRDGNNTIEFNMHFDRDGVKLKAGVIIYAIIVRDDSGYVKTDFKILNQTLVPLNITSKKGDQTFSVTVTLKSKEYYLRQLEKEFGTKKVKYYIVYRPMVFGYKDYLISSESLFKK